MSYFNKLSWPHKIRCVYQLYQELNMTFHEGKLAKAKESLYVK
jgi:hypothetical protein